MDFVSRDHEIPNWMESHKIQVPNYQPGLQLSLPTFESLWFSLWLPDNPSYHQGYLEDHPAITGSAASRKIPAVLKSPFKQRMLLMKTTQETINSIH